MKTWPICAHDNLEGVFFCEECGQPFVKTPGVQPTTHFTPEQVAAASSTRIAWGTARFGPSSEIMLHFKDNPESIKVEPIDELLLGRSDPDSGTAINVDLTPFGAGDCGVSRRHAAIRRGEDTLTLVDLGSTNGTQLNGQRLLPNQPRVLRDGDEIRLGKLSFHIYFK